MEYGQFCPIAKALEIVGEKWTVLIIRELLMGGSRFNELQRGLSLISPTILNKRLASLADYGLVLKKKLPGQQGYAYYPTDSCKQLLPVIKSLGDWGMRWARDGMSDRDFDIGLLMLYLERSVRTDKLIGDETVIHFKFTDVDHMADWWLIATPDEVDVCHKDPGKDVDVYFTCTVRTMVDLWMGDLTYKRALREDQIKAVGAPVLTRNIFTWLQPSVFADLPSAEEIQ
jgi:DNA-binding HxlR family transcriptional regulator